MLKTALYQSRAVFYQETVTDGTISYSSISASQYIKLIENRFFPLAHIEQIFDDNRLIFRYNEKRQRFSRIEADYLLSTPFSQNDIYIFLEKKETSGLYFCRSFFPKEQKDYTLGQPQFTLLFKEKICVRTGRRMVQYDRLTSRMAKEQSSVS